MGVLKPTGNQVLHGCAILAWLALLAWLAIAAAGGGKTAIDYADAAIVTPLVDGEVLAAGDPRRAFWSGWLWDTAKRRRVSVSMDPSIVFRRASNADACVAKVHALPLAPKQRVYVSLNRAEPTLIELDSERTPEIVLAGNARAGLNALSFHLPDAPIINERPMAIAVASLSIRCHEARRLAFFE
jgi:hypothetical protein